MLLSAFCHLLFGVAPMWGVDAASANTPPAGSATAATSPVSSDASKSTEILRTYQERWWPVVAYVVARMDDIAAELRQSGTQIAIERGTRTELAAAPRDTVSRYIRTFDFGHGTIVTAEIQPALLINDRISGWPSLRVWSHLLHGGPGLFMVVLQPAAAAGPGRAILHREDDDISDIPEYQSDAADFRADAKFRDALDAAIRATYRRAIEDAHARE